MKFQNKIEFRLQIANMIFIPIQEFRIIGLANLSIH